MVVDDAVRDDVDARAPDFVEQAVAREHSASLAHESGQELKLCRGCFQALARAAQLEADKIKFAVAEAVDLLPCYGSGTPQDGANAGAKLAWAEWLGYVVICSYIKAQNLFRLLA